MRNRAAQIPFLLSGGLVVFCLLFSYSAFSANESKFWVTFRDKKNTTFDPDQYFVQRTIEQRLRNNIPVIDTTDFPVSEEYLEQVRSVGAILRWPSRWLNGVAVYATEQQMEKIKAMPFVLDAEPMNKPAQISEYKTRVLKNEIVPLLKFQTSRMQGELFQKEKLDGKGIRIAVFDAGFPAVDKNPAFKKLRDDKRIVATYDFVAKKESVFGHHWHGTATLSCLTGVADSLNIGLATGAEYMLARTEYSFREPESEEENWLAAAEWADKNGANIISSSLGYTMTRYFNTELNGRKSLVARAATIAFQKGILVLNAAGNEGTSEWKFIDTPSDADSVLAIGGIDPESDFHISFSSFGPTSEGKLKPNLCGLGKAVVMKPGGISVAFGTSFSTPLVAGFAACAWQSHREWTNGELFEELQKSGHLYPYFDYAHGYGIPQASAFLHIEKSNDPTFDFVIINDEIKVILREKFSYATTEEALGYPVKRNLYYKIEDEFGRMRSYSVLLAQEKEVLRFMAEDFHAGDVVTVHFEGYTSSFDFPKTEIQQDDQIQK